MTSIRGRRTHRFMMRELARFDHVLPAVERRDFATRDWAQARLPREHHRGDRRAAPAIFAAALHDPDHGLNDFARLLGQVPVRSTASSSVASRNVAMTKRRIGHKAARVARIARAAKAAHLNTEADLRRQTLTRAAR
jgi:hypothetical protein